MTVDIHLWKEYMDRNDKHMDNDGMPIFSQMTHQMMSVQMIHLEVIDP